jgi:hypothetical protein
LVERIADADIDVDQTGRARAEEVRNLVVS